MKKYIKPELKEFLFNVRMDVLGASGATPEDATKDPWSEEII